MTDASQTEQDVDPSPVEALMQLVEKALRATQLYLPNNPMYRQALTNVYEGFKRFWQDEDDLLLVITAEGFEWRHHPILQGRDRHDSIAWTFYKDGVRSIVLRRGCEDEELFRLIRVVNRARMLTAGQEGSTVLRRMSQELPTTEQNEADDDLLTLLWTEEFELIAYDYIELGDEDYASLETSETYGSFGPPDRVQKTVQEDIADQDETKATLKTLATADDFDSTLYFLDPKELEYLKSEIDREYEQDLHFNVLGVLFDILEQFTFGNARSEVLRILHNMIPFYLGTGEFQAVAYVLREVRKVPAVVPDLSDEQRELLVALPRLLSTPQALTQLLQVLDESHQPPTEQELGELFRQLQPESLETLVAWIPRLHNETVRQVLVQSVDPLARANPERLVAVLLSDETESVMTALDVVSRLKLESVAPHLASLTSHDDPEVRRALAHALAILSTPTSLQQLIGMLDDADREVRVAAARALAEKRHYPAAGKVETVVFDRMRDADLSEKRILFAAYGVLARSDGIARLAGLLAPKGFLRRKDDPETRACAAEALGMVGTPEAKEVLQSIGREKDPLVRNAIEKAIREIV